MPNPTPVTGPPSPVILITRTEQARAVADARRRLRALRRRPATGTLYADDRQTMIDHIEATIDLLDQQLTLARQEIAP